MSCSMRSSRSTAPSSWPRRNEHACLGARGGQRHWRGSCIAGVRLVTHSGGTPLIGAYLIRNVFRLIDSFPVFYGLGLILTMLTRNHVRVGDLAAGTLLVYDHSDVLLREQPP